MPGTQAPDGRQFSEVPGVRIKHSPECRIAERHAAFGRDDAGSGDDRIVTTMTEAANIWGFAVSWAFYRVHPSGSSPPLRSVTFIPIIQRETGFMRMQRRLRHSRGCVESRSVWSDSAGLGGRAGQQPGRDDGRAC